MAVSCCTVHSIQKSRYFIPAAYTAPVQAPDRDIVHVLYMPLTSCRTRYTVWMIPQFSPSMLQRFGRPASQRFAPLSSSELLCREYARVICKLEADLRVASCPAGRTKIDLPVSSQMILLPLTSHQPSRVHKLGFLLVPCYLPPCAWLRK